MSLVNDLLIQLDRQSDAREHSRSDILHGLEPCRRSEVFRSSRVLNILVIVACLAFVSAGVAFIILPPALPHGSDRPPVSARPAAPAPAPAPAPALEGIRIPPLGDPPIQAVASTLRLGDPTEAEISRIDRPLSVHRLTVEKRTASTRLEIHGDPGLRYRIDRNLGDRHLEVVFDRATLTASIEALSLTGTPIRSISTKADGEAVRMRLGLDSGITARSQMISTAEGTRLVLDLQSEAPNARIQEPHASGPPRAFDASDAHPVSVEASIVTLQPLPPFSETMPDPIPLEIQRSKIDRARHDLEARKRLADQELTKARFARAEGDLSEASERYTEALKLFPNHREATFEGAQLLSTRGMHDQAIKLVRQTRKSNSTDVGLTLLHARLIEATGRRQDAVLLLDRSGFSLTEAPEIFALAAAYAQRDGDHEGAVERYESIVRRYPGESKWWMGLGISLEAVERIDEAADVYRIAMQIGDLSRPARQWVSSRVEALQEES